MMWINVLNLALIVFVVSTFIDSISSSRRTTEAKGTGNTKISSNGLKTKNEILDKKSLKKKNIRKLVKTLKSQTDHVANALVGHFNDEIQKYQERKNKAKRKRRAKKKVRNSLHEKLASLVKSKGDRNSKRIRKLPSKSNSKKDRELNKEDNVGITTGKHNEHDVKNASKLPNENRKSKKKERLNDSDNDKTTSTKSKDVKTKHRKKLHKESVGVSTVSSAKTDEKSEQRKDSKTHEDRHAKSKTKKKHHRNRGKVLPREKLEKLYEALLVHPFDTWKFKERFHSMADIGIHEKLLHDVVENRWNTRLEHKLLKVYKGENIHLAIIGGSNTAGGGLQVDEGSTDGLFFRVISDWWRKTITPITGSHLKTRQIAMGGTASDFFQYCHRSYVQKNVDVVLLEMSVNDLHELPYKVNLSLPIEQLTRQLLEYPTEPALVYVNLINGRAYYQGCTNLEDFGQKLLSDAYEVTTFSWRDAVCPVIDGKYRAPLKGCSVICKDGHHINQLGHAHISLMLINLFRDLLLGTIDHVRELSKQVFHDEVILPKPVFITKESKIITDPICWTTVSPNFKRKIISNSMEVGVMENYGFDYLHDKRIGAPCAAANSCRADAYSGWTGEDVGASLTVSFTVPALGHKRAIQSRSVVFATRTCWKCGNAEVWLDDDYINRRLVRGKSQFAQTLSEIIALRVNPGDHTMSVKIVQPGFVTVVGIMLGPPDGPY